MIGALLEFLDWLQVALAAWRYLVSPSYRRWVHEEWRDERWYYIAWDVVGGIAGIVVSGVILFGVYQVVMHLAGR